MIVDPHANQKTVFIWLTSKEGDDETVRADLAHKIVQYRDQGFFAVIMISGHDNLQTNTLAILRHNREISSQKTIEN